jgi:hypothetical protein
VLGLDGVLAACCGPGWRALTALCSAAWLYLGVVAAVVLPDATGSWGRVAGVLAMAVGVSFAVTAWRGRARSG